MSEHKHVVWITFRGDAPGDRKKPFTLLQEGNWGEVFDVKQFQEKFYTIRIRTGDDIGEIHSMLKTGGVFVLLIVIEGGHIEFKSRHYNLHINKKGHRSNKAFIRAAAE